MKRILVFQHVPYEILGTLNPLLKNAGIRIRYVNFGRHPDAKPTMDKYDGLVVLGGPMNVRQTRKYPHLRAEIKCIEQALDRKVPLLGICLGAQLIASALGAEVNANRTKEIGWYDVALTNEGKKDRLFKHFKKREKIFQWHGDRFNIPRGAKRLALTSTCRNQAFRYRDNVYGFQFHLEVDSPMIDRWVNIPAMKKEMAEEKISKELVIKETKKNISNSMVLSEKTFGEYLNCFATKKKRVALASGH